MFYHLSLDVSNLDLFHCRREEIPVSVLRARLLAVRPPHEAHEETFQPRSRNSDRKRGRRAAAATSATDTNGQPGLEPEPSPSAQQRRGPPARLDDGQRHDVDTAAHVGHAAAALQHGPRCRKEPATVCLQLTPSFGASPCAALPHSGHFRGKWCKSKCLKKMTTVCPPDLNFMHF